MFEVKQLKCTVTQYNSTIRRFVCTDDAPEPNSCTGKSTGVLEYSSSSVLLAYIKKVKVSDVSTKNFFKKKDNMRKYVVPSSKIFTPFKYFNIPNILCFDMVFKNIIHEKI